MLSTYAPRHFHVRLNRSGCSLSVIFDTQRFINKNSEIFLKKLQGLYPKSLSKNRNKKPMPWTVVSDNIQMQVLAKLSHDPPPPKKTTWKLKVLTKIHYLLRFFFKVYFFKRMPCSSLDELKKDLSIIMFNVLTKSAMYFH